MPQACRRRHSLTHAAVDHLRYVYPRELSEQKIVVIPTCADLERFRPLPVGKAHPLIYGCVGTVTSGWFRLDWLAGFFLVAAEREPEAEFHVITRDDPKRVRAAIGGDEAFQRRLKVYAMAPRMRIEPYKCKASPSCFFRRA